MRGASLSVRDGEWVVTAGIHFLSEGQEVRLLSNGNHGNDKNGS